MKVLGIIPARFASSRFPGKPLALIAGRTMLERVYRRASGASSLDCLLVATDDQRIAECVNAFGGRVVLTSSHCHSGMDRVAEAAKEEQGFEIVANIQGDEPLLEPEAVDLAVSLIKDTPQADITTLVRPARNIKELDDPNNVKVVLAEGGKILYFSRSRIPYCRDQITWESLSSGDHPYLVHLGLYVYRLEALLKLASLPPSRLEKYESLEQLRAMEAGFSFYAASVDKTISIGVDVPGDIPLVESRIRELGLD